MLGRVGLDGDIEWCRRTAWELRAKADEFDALADHWEQVTGRHAPTLPAQFG